MTKRLIIAAVLAMIGHYALAAMPATVGQLLDSGGKQLTASEIRQLFAGATIGGPALGGYDASFRVSYRPDGTASGEVSTSGGSQTLTGTWSANQNNQYCQNLRTAQGMAIPGCFYYFTLGNRLFMAAGKDRSAQVSERQVTH
ncbi:MAG: hypothetical protein ACM3JG_12885 [Thiohalocapsa sp.]